MANVLRVEMQHSVISLFERGYSRRKIARMLGINRRTVSRHIELWLAGESKCTGVSTGSGGGIGPKCAGVSTGSATVDASACEPYRDRIRQWVESGLSAQRIYQDLVADHGFGGSYKSVQRFVRKFRGNGESPARRLECAPGEELQVDFGRAAPVVVGKGRRRYPHLFRVVLGHSRKAYSEVVPRQTTEHFIRALENAFRHFGGVTTTVVIDNLRAAVKKADWYEPELHPKIRSFCEHYGTTILPAKPYHPERKGKVERGVGYAKDNALKGRCFGSIAEQNRFLLRWESHVADTRIHGTTRQQVRAAFERERPFLQALPPTLFPAFEEGRRSVHRDQHIEVGHAYYSVPPEYLRRDVWARYDTATVKVYNGRFELIAVHVRKEPGGRSTHPAHIPPERICGLERGEAWQLRKASLIGPNALSWAKAMLKARGLPGIRVLQGLIHLPGCHSAASVDAACRDALALAAFRLKDVKQLIRQPVCQQTLAFLKEHELIRQLSWYEAMTPPVFAEAGATKEGTNDD
jgi:transposase